MNFFESFVNTHPSEKIGKKEYIVSGRGKTAFLIFPGAGQDAFSCYDLIDYYENKYKVVAVGYEDSQSVDEFFKYVNKILNRQKAGKVILYGLSLGGFLAQHYVRAYPEKVDKLILSHAGSTKSKVVVRGLVKPAKFVSPFIDYLPVGMGKRIFDKLISIVESGKSDTKILYQKYSTRENWERRRQYLLSRKMFNLLNKRYLSSVIKLGLDILDKEKKFSPENLKNWKGKILIIKTDNDPLAQDDGIFKTYYPKAKVVVFHKTGHLTPFIQFEKMVKTMDRFLDG